MARSKLNIANLSLSKLGNAQPITSFQQSGSTEAERVNEVYNDILEEVLSEHPWSFAQRRVALTVDVPDDVSRHIQGRVFTPVSITGATKAEPCVITAVDHGLENGDRIKIVGVSGMTQLNGNFYRIQGKTVDTIELIDEDIDDGVVEIDSSAYTTYSSGGQIQLANDGDPLAITAATAANPVVITAAAHGLSDGDWIKIVGVAGMTNLNGNFYIVDDATTNTFSLDDTDEASVDGLTFGAYTYGGIILVADEFPALDSETDLVVYQKPSDFVKLIKKSEKNATIHIEENKIISDFEDLKIIYTFLNEDVTSYSPQFIQALSLRLAAELAFTITNSTAKSKDLMTVYYDIVLPQAVSKDSTQNTPTEAQAEEWLDAPIHGSGYWPATTGETWHPS